MTAPRKASFVQGVGCWLAYLSLLAPVVIYAGVRFGPLYSANSLVTEPALSEQYKVFVSLTGIGLAIGLGIAAAVFGVWRTSVPQGFLALALGAATTIAALSIVPLVRFPEDHYPPAALWVIADGLPLVVTFAIATAAGWLITKGGTLQTETGR